MHPLSAAELQTRLNLDRDLIAGLDADASAPVKVTGHRSVTDAVAQRGTVDGGPPPTVYRAVYDVPTLAGPDRPYTGQTVIVFDLLANGNYPYAEPVARVVGHVPWAPHFDAARPVCLGHSVWLPSGRTTAAELIVHVGRLLNFDEPAATNRFSGWNGAAIQWWTQRGCRPLNPSLTWPLIDPNRNLGRPGSIRHPDRSADGIRTVRTAASTDGIRTTPPVAGGAIRTTPATPAGIRTVPR